jgi:hypothetical protein
MKTADLQAKMGKQKPEVTEKPETNAQEQTEMAQENPHPINQLTARVFSARNASHRAHLLSKSFSEHMALGAFYDEVIEKIDEVIEVDQGMYGLIGDFTVEDIKPTDFAKFIREEAMWIELNREKFSKCAATLALIDDLTAIYLRTAYKLTNLK